MTNASPSTTTPSRQAKTKLPTLKGSFHSTVLLLISANETPFIVHDNLLCSHSAFFRTALCGPNTYLETHTRKIHLPEETPEEMESLLQWLYTRNLSHLSPSPASSTSSVESQTNAHYSSLINLYFLADRLLMPLLKNDIIDSIIALERDSAFVPCTEHVRLVFERCTSPRDPLRRLLVDMHAYDVEPAFIRDNADSFTKEFLIDLIAVTMGFCEDVGAGMGKGRERPWVRDVKGYYENLD